MDNTIFSEIVNFLQNHSDGQQIVQQSNVPPSDMHRVAQEVIPKITDKVKNSPQTLGDLFKILSENKNDPRSLLNSQPGFDQQKAESEGNDILKAIFGSSGETKQLADEVSQKTGVSTVDINSLLPMIATMATKLLGGKVDSVNTGNTPQAQENIFDEVLGYLGGKKEGAISGNLAQLGNQILGRLFSQDSSDQKPTKRS